MANTVAAVGAFADDGNPLTVTAPGDQAEVIAKLNEILAKYNTGDVLPDEDKEIVRAYLPTVGIDETGLSADNAFVGKGTFEFDRQAANVEVHAKGNMGCAGVGEGRIEWHGSIELEKTGGTGSIYDIEVTFAGIGFGVGPTGQMKVIYKREFTRDFPGKEAVAASFFDRYTLTQWGFYYTVSTNLKTNEGVVTVQ